MYVSREEARSDLFLAGAVYIFGPLIVALLLRIVPLGRIPGFQTGFLLVAPLLFTVFVPALLMRYRDESLETIGLGKGADGSLPTGVLAAFPVVLAGLVVATLVNGTPLASLPILGNGASPVVSLASRVLLWGGLGFLIVYATTKARDAFGGQPVAIDEAAVRIGRFIGIVCGVAIVLILLARIRVISGASAVALLGYPLGVVAAVAVTLRSTAVGQATTTLPTVLTPVVLLAWLPFHITFDALQFLQGIYTAALFGGLGLAGAVIVERSRRGLGVIALGIIIALLSRVDGGFAMAALSGVR